MRVAFRRSRPAPQTSRPESLVTSVARSGDAERAAMAVVRPLLRRGRIGRLRTTAQLLQRNPRTAVAGDVAQAMLALHDGRPERAWELVRAHEPARVLRLAPAEVIRAGCLAAPDEALAVVAALRAGEINAAFGPRGWLAIANATFAIGAEDLSAWALDRAIAGAATDGEIARDAEWLRGWYGRRQHRAELGNDQPAFALLDSSSPQRPRDRAPAPDDRQERVMRAALQAASAGDSVRTYRVGRDATSFADVPAGTWLVVVGRLPRPLFGIGADIPFDERYRPVFASVRVEGVRSLTAATAEQLRQCAPVGCADWETYYLMRAAGIPAFFADAAPNAVQDLAARIVGGADEAAARAAWADTCAPAVAAGLALDDAVARLPPIEVDIEGACRAVRQKSVTVERSRPGPAGEEINLEFSLDGNLKHHMVVVLDSIERRASRPIRLYVMCRDHDRADYERLAELFPTVSFVWLPTDDIDYGPLAGMIGHITVATMDRLLLPELLPEVTKIVHHDLDAVCLADLAELAATELQGHPIAAVTTARATFRSGLGECRGTAHRLRKNGDPALARELIARSHLRHRLDYDVFNAGVMVLDLERMRADGFTREFFPYAEQFGMNDQAVLNVYAGADRLALDPAWNWCPRLEEMAQPRIAHWSGPVKPWQDRWVNGQELWREAERLAATRLRTPRANAAVK